MAFRSLCDSWPFYFVAIQHRPERLPVEASPLTPAIQPFLENAYRLVKEFLQALIVPDHTEVIVVSTKFSVQVREQLPYRRAAILPTPLREILQ